jgi:hypothetical protein
LEASRPECDYSPPCGFAGKRDILTFSETASRAEMPDDAEEDRRWIIMSARRRLEASRAALRGVDETKAQAHARLEASRKLLGRARVDFIIYGYPHKPEGPDK